MNLATIITFVIYLIGMLLIGLWTYRKTNTISDYFLGGRKLNSWVAAMSAQASDMSGWLLLGLPGAIYVTGLNGMWIAIGLAVGTYLNWQFIAKRLRRYTETVNSITIPDYLENRFKDNTKVIRVFSALTIILFFLFYASSGMVAGAVLFEQAFGIDYNVALLVGSVVIVSYTFLGGFLAVSLTDFIQGILMFCALLLVPAVLIVSLGGFSGLWGTISDINVDLLNIMKTVGVEDGTWATNITSFSIIGTISLLAWGLGYFGQPHILTRFMSIRSASEIPKARLIAVVWVVLSLIGAGFVGLVGITQFDTPLENPESIFIILVQTLFNPWVAGILLAAILAAIMSTIDSQLLVSSSAIAEDFYKQILRKEASEKELVWISRASVIFISVIAVILAKNGGNVLELVSYAWAGFGAAFGPVIILSLYWKRMTRYGALAGILTGTFIVIFWNEIPVLNAIGLYELVPGFVLATVAVVLVSMIDRAPSAEIEAEFNQSIYPNNEQPTEKYKSI
ncbi:sodium/proline symporter PutP [Alkalihalobacillus sp. BA299]|uniref:sodium/proline symporter PutP n=1 Tax=Alkalihalobacillus sp. BA299 TaxID=2815938 RepID=UPI001AD9CB44|nr:sodium/proline symporter PutP [Alkalihalobacillus sp. BA299]